MSTPDPATLKEPVTEWDAADQAEYMEVCAATLELMFHRVRFQYQGDTWISNELWEIYLKSKEAADRLNRLRETNCFPPEPTK